MPVEHRPQVDSFSDETKGLEERIRRLAAEKANLQLSNNLMNKLAEASGLANTIEALLGNMAELIGGENLVLYYWLDQVLWYTDVFGESKPIKMIMDELVLEVIETRLPKEVVCDLQPFNPFPTDIKKSYTWIIPLVVGTELIGILKIDKISIGMQELSQQLPTFFHFAALVLRNEILDQSEQKKAYDRLAVEVEERKQAERKLSDANAELERRVAKRTAELESTNAALAAHANQISELLNESKRNGETLLRILEEQKLVENKLIISESHFRALFENSPIGLWEEDFSAVKLRLDELRNLGVNDFRFYLTNHMDEVKHLASLIKVLMINNVGIRLVGAHSEEEVMRQLPFIFDLGTWPVFTEEMIAIATGHTTFSDELFITDLSGKNLVLILNILIPPGYEDNLQRVIVSLIDITERKNAENQVKVLLREKEILLKEVHHRVKNNMNTISSLLNLQLESQEDETARMALLDASGRVKSMMILYDRLYRSENFGAVALDDFIPDLVEEVATLFPNHRSVTVITEIETIFLSPKLLSPLGIIINELTTNAMKYAFPEGREGVVMINATENAGRCTVQFADNGIGFPESFSLDQSTGFGIQLVNLLVGQIDGSITFERNNGSKIILVFDIK